MPATEFFKDSSSLDGLTTRCKSCRKVWQRHYRIQRDYGLSPKEYQALFTSQGERCAICGSTESNGKSPNFVVDHDHATGKVRGLLCNLCNPALGLMQDSPERLEAAAQYLREHA